MAAPALGLALALLVQLTAAPLYALRLGPWLVMPSFPVAWVAASALAGGRRHGWLLALGVGAGLDLLSLDPPGAQAAALAIAAVAGQTVRRSGVGPGLAGAAGLVAAAVVAELGRGFALWLWREESAWPDWAPAMGSAGLTGLVAMVILPLAVAAHGQARRPRLEGV